MSYSPQSIVVTAERVRDIAYEVPVVIQSINVKTEFERLAALITALQTRVTELERQLGY